MRLSLRLRLTVVYGALFMLAGVVLVGVTYLLFNQELVRIFEEKYGDPGGNRHRFISVIKDGVMLSPEESQRLLAEQEADLRAAATTSLLAQGVIAVVVVACLATALGWVVAGRVLAPLHKVTATARRIAAAPPTPTAACASGSTWTGRSTRSRSWPTPSTPWWRGSTGPSTGSAGSSPTPRTSCAPR
ncbi:hypothetical protein ACFSTC_58330 [Nonomuraea ferruginea]